MEAEKLLQELLVEWRRTHDAALEAPIERVGIEVARLRGEIVSPTQRLLEQTWHEVAARLDVGDVTRLLEMPLKAKLRARVAALSKFPADPRITNGLVPYVHQYPSWDKQPLHKEIAALMQRAPTSGIERARSALAGNGLRQCYDDAARTLRELPRTAADAALLTRANADAAKPVAELEALWAHHDAHPGDLAHRAILADALTLAGDPRGELIVAQTAIAEGRGTPTLEKRVHQLIRTHRARWLAGLPKTYAKELVFERGFLAAFETTEMMPAGLQIDSRDWLTMRRVRFMNLRHGFAPLLARMPLLERLSAHAMALAETIEHGPFPTVRSLDTNWDPWVPPPGAFPDLAVLGGNWLRADSDASSRLAAARALGVAAFVFTSQPVERLADVLALRSPELPELRMTTGYDATHSYGWCIRIARDHPEAHVSWMRPAVAEKAGAYGEAILEMLGAAKIERVHLCLAWQQAPALEAAARAAGIELVRTTDEVDVGAF